MYDVNVDTSVLNEIRERLKRCNNVFLTASSEMKSHVQRAGEDLDGRQYRLSVSETEQSCGIIEASAANLQSLTEYLNQLEESLQEYFQCMYSED